MKLHIIVDLDSDALAGVTEGEFAPAQELRTILNQVAHRVSDQSYAGGGIKDRNGNFAADYHLVGLERGDVVDVPAVGPAEFDGIWGVARTPEGREVKIDPRLIRLDWRKPRG